MSTEDRLWRVLDRRKLFEVPGRVEVYRETVRLPDGRTIDDYYQTVEKSFAVVLAETASGEAVLLRQYKHGPRRIQLSLPGGEIDAAEAPLAAAQRELLEETGYGGGEWTALGSFCTAGCQGGATAHAFHCKGAIKLAEPNAGDLEEMTVELLDRAALTKAIGGGEFAVAGDLATLSLALLR
jgi:ADP-ribose pyrophosphatase